MGGSGKWIFGESNLFGVIFRLGTGECFSDAQFGAYFLVFLRLFLFLVLVFEAFLLGFFFRLGLFLGRRGG
jgi:hypothetical protein